MDPDPTLRFSSRAYAYARHRPSYPQEIVELMQRECGLSSQSHVADIGCGTGLLAELFLRFGCHVTGVEPNAEMREAGARLTAAYPQFQIVEGRAEATTLPNASVDFVTAGQAFHWFQPEPSHRELLRILRPKGWLALIWNERSPAAGGFQADYEALISRYAPETGRIQEEAIQTMFGHTGWRLATFDNAQQFDGEGLAGRLASSSYAPVAGTPEFEEMRRAVAELFEDHERDGKVTLRYDTLMYYGQPG